MFTGAHDKLVDKCLLTTMQLKAAALVKVSQNYLSKLNYHTHHNMKTSSMLTVAH